MPERYTFLGQHAEFWVAVIIATFIRLFAKPPSGETWKHRTGRLVFSVAAAVAIPFYFTHPVLDWRGLDPDTWTIPIAVLLTLTGQNIVELLVSFDWEKIKEAVATWRGVSKGEKK